MLGMPGRECSTSAFGMRDWQVRLAEPLVPSTWNCLWSGPAHTASWRTFSLTLLLPPWCVRMLQAALGQNTTPITQPHNSPLARCFLCGVPGRYKLPWGI